MKKKVIDKPLASGSTDNALKCQVYKAEKYSCAKAVKVIENTNVGDASKFLELAGALHVIRENHWYRELGYESFDNFVIDRSSMSTCLVNAYIAMFALISKTIRLEDQVIYLTEQLEKN